jgi:hypothetical protein
MVLLNELIVTHNRLRHPKDIERMVEFVSIGGYYTESMLGQFAKNESLSRVSPLIQIARFEDGKMYVHDGHHRAVSCWLAGRQEMPHDEYQITDWTYQQYLEISHENGWYTPFDPRIHVRTPDFNKFKKEARQRFLESDHSQWINENVHLFREDRKIITVEELSHLGRNIHFSDASHMYMNDGD